MIAHDKPSPSDTSAPQPAPGTSRRARVFLWVFSVILVVTAGTAFMFKLIEFFYTATTDGSQALASFLIPVLTYLTVAAGFGCLFAWAFFRGHYSDVEAPKYRMLELQNEIERAQACPPPHAE